MTDSELIKLAIEARKKSYSPYSNFSVGAALLTKSGKVYLGCNIENAAFSMTNCAERTAFFKAVSEGETEFEAIAVVGSPHGDELVEYAYPCGACRQVMREFCDVKEFMIIAAKSENEYIKEPLEAFLPHSFGPEFL